MVLHIAPEQDHSRRWICPQRGAGFGVEDGAGNSDDGSMHAPFCHSRNRSTRLAVHYECTTMH